MYRLMTYPLNVSVMMLFALLLSCFPLSYFYNTPELTDIIQISIIILTYALLSLFFKRSSFESKNSDNNGKWKVFLKISLVGFVVEFLYGGIPLISGREVAKTIPVLHVVFYSCAIISVLFASLYNEKKHVFISLFYAFVISALLLSRQMMMISFIMVIISLTSRYIFSGKQLRRLLAGVVCIIFIFAAIGNFRQQISGDYTDNYILKIGGANSSGELLGDALYWIWLYISSPIYNLLENFHSYEAFGDQCNKAIAFGTCDGSYLFSVLIPDTISKHFSDPFLIDMVKSHLNAGTAFSAPARIMGIYGVALQIVLQAILYVIGFNITPKQNRKAFVIYFSTLSFFMIFDNLYIKGEFFFGFIVIFISGFKFRFGIKSRNVISHP